MMRESIEKFPQQFLWEPVIENADNFRHREQTIVIGMGGSHLAADIVKAWKPELKLSVWSDYGLPYVSDAEKENTLIVASSYSGNTEEILDGYAVAQNLRIPLLVISTGGQLLQYARRDGVPCIQIPDTDIQPRMSLGFGVKAILKALGRERELEEVFSLAVSLSVETAERAGKGFAEKLKSKIPIVYASMRNRAIASIWKIKFNETAKIPAFYNVFPELNHNEMTGFDAADTTRGLSEHAAFLFLFDEDDDQRIKRRADFTQKLFEERGFLVVRADSGSAARIEKIMYSLLIADWTAFFLAERYGVDPEQVPMVEDLKKRMNG